MSKKEVVKIIEEKIESERNKLLKLMNKRDNLGLKEELAKKPEIDKINAEIEEKENIRNVYLNKQIKAEKATNINLVLAAFGMILLTPFILMGFSLIASILTGSFIIGTTVAAILQNRYLNKHTKTTIQQMDLENERDEILERRSEKYINLQEKIDNKWNLINQLEKELENYKNINKNKRNLEKFEKETEKKYLKQSEEVLTK